MAVEQRRVPSTHFRAGDIVQLPSGRLALIERLRSDGRLDLRYYDERGRLDMGMDAIVPLQPYLVKFAPVQRKRG